MRRRASIVLAVWLAGCALIGCNLILGSESAVFEPDGGGGAEAGDATIGPDSTGMNDGGGDGSDGPLPDANPCVDTANNPQHCGACGHSCLGGACVSSRCQPVVIVTEPGNAEAIAVDGTHVYWTNTAAGDVRRAPLAGGAAETLYDGPAGTSLGKRLVRTGAHVYFTIEDPNGGVYRCPAAGCAGAAPEAVIAPLDSPGFISLSDAGKLLVLETNSGGRVGRCTLPCAGGLDEIVATAEGLPVYGADDGDDVYWSTIIPAGGELRARQGGAGAPATIRSTALATEIAIVGSEVLFIELGTGPVAVQRTDGGAHRRLSTSTVQAERLLVDKGLVYFNDSAATTGRILSCAVGGCGDAGAVLASNQIRPFALAVDATSVYWTNKGDADAGASVMRVAK